LASLLESNERVTGSSSTINILSACIGLPPSTTGAGTGCC
jgi:hypothetical protein